VSGNLPSLSPRAQRALDVLSNGGVVSHRLERNAFTGREQFQTRFCLRGAVVKGLGFATHKELEASGFRFKQVYRSSVSTEYKLDHR